ncbi:MAG: Fic family protein [Clostridia bacterium]
MLENEKTDEGSKMQEKFKELEELKIKLEQIKPFTEDELSVIKKDDKIQELKYVFSANKVDGCPFTITQSITAVSLKKKIFGVPLTHNFISYGIQAGLEYIYELLEAGEVGDLTEQVMKDIHTQIIIDKPLQMGYYRKEILDFPRTYKCKAPMPEFIQERMTALLANYLADESPFIEKLARFHMDFRAINPFDTSSNAVNLIILNYELMKQGYLPINICFEEDEEIYENAFIEHNVTRNVEPMVNLICRHEKIELERYLSVRK